MLGGGALGAAPTGLTSNSSMSNFSPGLGRNLGRAARSSVSKGLGNDQPPVATHSHTDHPLVPAFDNGAGPERKVEGGTVFARAVEGDAVHQRARVVHADRVARLRFLALANDIVENLERGRTGIRWRRRGGLEVALAGLRYVLGATCKRKR